MAKTGRNDPCHCGSGKKYKRCCEGADQAASSAKLQADAKASRDRLRAVLHPFEPDPYDSLDDDSNAVVDLVRAGKLDEAEKAARELLVRYPAVIDGHERLGMVFEARGDRKQAAAHYRDALDFIARNPEGFEDASSAYYRDRLQELDPPSPS
jgi:tetratricopeptide (TPR) repeat protein